MNLNLLCKVACENTAVDFKLLFLIFFNHLLIFSVFTKYCLFHVLLVLIHLTTISWSTRVRAIMEEDRELSCFFPFPIVTPKFVDNSSHDPCDFRASIVFVQ